MTPAERKRAHEAGLAAVKRGESYSAAFHGTKGVLLPSPYDPHAYTHGTGGTNPAGVVDDPLYGHRAVLNRGRVQYLEPDPEPFDWQTLAYPATQ